MATRHWMCPSSSVNNIRTEASKKNLFEAWEINLWERLEQLRVSLSYLLLQAKQIAQLRPSAKSVNRYKPNLQEQNLLSRRSFGFVVYLFLLFNFQLLASFTHQNQLSGECNPHWLCSAAQSQKSQSSATRRDSSYLFFLWKWLPIQKSTYWHSFHNSARYTHDATTVFSLETDVRANGDFNLNSTLHNCIFPSEILFAT